MRLAAVLAVAGALAALVGGPARAERDERPPAGMKARVFEVKHQDPEDLVHALRPLASGARGAMLNDSDSLRSITVRDFPENVAAIEQALKRLDVPVAPKPDVEVKVRILLGSVSEGAGSYPPELESVVKQLGATLNYKSYYQVASLTQRVKAGSGSGGKGHFQLTPPAVDESTGGHFHFGVENVSLAPPSPPSSQLVVLKKLKLSFESDGLGEAEVATGLTLREGEKVVVGTGSLKNRAMIVVVSVRLLRS
jgi:hypothetical protein